jgi:hypothetical protein
MEPDMVADWLEGRLPRPVDDLEQWTEDDDEASESRDPRRVDHPSGAGKPGI